MTRTFSIFFAFLSVLLLLTGCGNVALMIFQPKSTGLVEDPDSLLADMQGRCGASMTDLSDPDFVLLTATFKSLPITSEGVKDGISYKVTTQAASSILAKGGSSQVSVNAAVQSMSAQDSSGVVLTAPALDRVVRPSAESNIAASSGTIYSSSTPGSHILRLSRQDGPYKNMLCAVSFTASQKDTLGGGTGELKFDQPTPLSINPRAAAATYEAELGAGKIFSTNVSITTSKTGWPQANTSIPIVVTWRKVATDINQSSQVTGQTLPAIKADVAYEVTVTSSSVQPFVFGISRRRVYYVDTTARQLVAIVDDSGKPQIGEDNKILPVTVLIPQ